MHDLNGRIQQLTKLILTSATIDESKEGDSESRPASPVKIDFDMSPYQLQQELLAARLQIESQANQILSLEASLLARPSLPADASSDEKDRLIAEQTKTIRELEIAIRGYEDNLGEPLRKVKEDVEKEWAGKLEEERQKSERSERWAEEVVKALEKEKKVCSKAILSVIDSDSCFHRQTRQALEEERRALAAFVSKFDSLGLGLSVPPSKLRPPMPTPGGAMTAYERRQSRSFSGIGRLSTIPDATVSEDMTGILESSPMRLRRGELRAQPSLLDQAMLEEFDGAGDISFDELEVEKQLMEMSVCIQPGSDAPTKMLNGLDKGSPTRARSVFGDKENVVP